MPVTLLDFTSLESVSRSLHTVMGWSSRARGVLVVNQVLCCAGDIIIGLNSNKVRNYADLFEALDQYKPGDKVNLEVYRTTSRKQITIPVTLGARSTEVQDG
jgi:S1-C subfamily serine protease